MNIVKTKSKRYNLYFKGGKLNRIPLSRRDLQILFDGYYGGDDEMLTDEMMDPSKVTYTDQSEDSALNITDAGIGILKNIPEAGQLLNNIYGYVKPIAQFITSIVPDKRLPSVQFYAKTGVSPADWVFNRPFDYLIDLETGQPDFSNYSIDIQNKSISFQRYYWRKFTSVKQFNDFAHTGKNPYVPPDFKDSNALYAPLQGHDLYAVTQWFHSKDAQAGDLYNILVKIGPDAYNELGIPVTPPDGMYVNNKGQTVKG